MEEYRKLGATDFFMILAVLFWAVNFTVIKIALRELYMANEPEGSVVALDFSSIGIIDYSCADEIVTKLVSRLLSGEYGNKYLMLAGLNENQKEN